MTRNPRSDLVIIPAPAPWINANQRLHWAARARLTRAWREAAGWHARADRIARFTSPVNIRAVVHKSTIARFDPHNLVPTVKAAVDGLVDARVLLDDDSEHLRVLSVEDGGRREKPCLVLLVTVAGTDGEVAS